MKYILLNVIFFFLAAVAVAQTPAVEWDKTFGIGSFIKAVPSKDGGYLLAAQSGANAGFDKTEDGRGGVDYWVIKIDKNGNKQWDKTFGGSADDFLTVAAPTSDGGYILGGGSQSGMGGDKSEPVKTGAFSPAQDNWIVKIDSLGNKEWDRTIGNDDYDRIAGIHEAVGGGYLLVCATSGTPNGDKTDDPINENVQEGWIVKLSSKGVKLWDKVVGTGGLFSPITSQILSDGGLLISSDHNYESNGDRFNMMRVDSAGNKMWYRHLRGEDQSRLLDIKQSRDGGFLLAGYTSGRASGDQSEDASIFDYWIIKTDSAANKIWDRVLGSLVYEEEDLTYGDDFLYSLTETADGGVVAVGISDSVDPGKDKTEPGFGGDGDMWIVKLDSNGATQWDKTIGGAGYDVALSILPASDGGYIVTGNSSSPKNNFKSEDPKGVRDIWVFKLVDELPPLPVTLQSFSAGKEAETTLLTWQTTSETNSDHFELQHSFNGKAWTNLAIIHAQGESKSLNVYHYTHTTPVLGSDNLYRLKMVDADGTSAYSKIRHVKFEEEFKVTVYPNPAAETIHLKAADWSKVKGLQILNSQGKALYSSGIKPAQDINTKMLKPGLYFIKVTLTDGTESTRKFVVAQ
ncbi:T9SS type A sorting domain-containing protein [Dyadobacter sandarakinus]|uniref:T9SS type A sorting domain-containing protein n=1 Tax=Dyadobacter sandarakinus TaxID=2747268 RepID=A0ABX7I692_9BACT|nr:T9SS type A sorting domain-containing protein [Dyadobacter sandarakinus]QRR01394.1 T9SS type A sorting domain-containing protein [Dyadobacter sandarakinus]